jgi:predicted secreted protein
MTEYRKTIKATLMASCSEKTESAKESYAYSHPEYKKHLLALQQAVAEAEFLRWRMVAAEAKIEVWRSLESSARAEGRSTV